MQNHGTKWIVKRTIAYSVRAEPNRQSRDFPRGPVFKMPHFHCGGSSSIPGQGTKSPYAT